MYRYAYSSLTRVRRTRSNFPWSSQTHRGYKNFVMSKTLAQMEKECERFCPVPRFPPQKVAVVGAGSDVGRIACLFLKQQKVIRTLAMYDDIPERCVLGTANDLAHIDTSTNSDVVLICGGAYIMPPCCNTLDRDLFFLGKTQTDCLTRLVREADELICRVKSNNEQGHLSIGFSTARFVVNIMKGLFEKPTFIDSALVEQGDPEKCYKMPICATPVTVGKGGIVEYAVPTLNESEMRLLEESKCDLEDMLNLGRCYACGDEYLLHPCKVCSPDCPCPPHCEVCQPAKAKSSGNS